MKFLTALVWLAVAALVCGTASQFASAFRKETPTQRVERQEALVSEADVKCLGLEIWHGADRGKASAAVQRLIGRTALAVRAETGKSLCTVFEQCVAMLPTGYSGCTRSVEVVLGEQWLGNARAQSAASAELLARYLFAHPEQGAPSRFVRNFSGLLGSVKRPDGFHVFLNPLEKLRAAFQEERGDPIVVLEGYYFYK